MKLAYFYSIITLIISTNNYCYSNNLSGINANGVRVREHNDQNSQVIASLKTSDKIEILSVDDSYTTVNKYYGRWVKVRLSDGKEGYILSCFVENVDQFEPFHKFCESFVRSVFGTDNFEYFVNRTVIPLTCQDIAENTYNTIIKTKTDLRKRYCSNNERWPYGQGYRVYLEKDTVCISFNPDGIGLSRTYKLTVIDGKWYCINIESVNM